MRKSPLCYHVPSPAQVHGTPEVTGEQVQLGTVHQCAKMDTSPLNKGMCNVCQHYAEC